MTFDLQTKRILVTGGHGFLGSHIVEKLQQEGCKSIAAPRRAEADLTKAHDVDRLFHDVRPQLLVHAAALAGGIGANMAEPGRFFYENILMGVQVIDAARRFGVEKVVVLGTICAYPKFTPVPFREEDLWNGYPEETNAPYGIAKRALLAQCQAYRQQYGMNAIFLLPVNLYGPRDNFDLNTSHVIPALIRKCIEAREAGAAEITLWGDGSPTREFLYVEDAAEAVVSAARLYNNPDPVNVGSGIEISIRDLATTIALQAGFCGQIVWDASKPNGQPRRCLDVMRAEEEFGFRARTNFNQGIRQTIDWYASGRHPASRQREL